MKARLLLPLLALPLLGAAPDARLERARAEARAAQARADALWRQADGERDEAGRTARREAALSASIAAAEAEIRAARERVAIAGGALAASQARLAAQRLPITRLMAALQSFARVPAAAAVVQPGSVAQAVRVRAVIGAIAPVIDARTAAVRAEIARARTLRTAAADAVAELGASRDKLQAQRLELVKLEADQRARGAELAGSALVESDRALALGERARDLVAEVGVQADARETAARLAAIDGPLPRPDALGSRTEAPQRAFGIAPYRLPAAGRVVYGTGELAETGVRARGVTIETAAGAAIVAPARGVVRFARPFRDYGTVVIVDHGDGWSSALTGLSTATVRDGARVAVGEVIGSAAPVGSPRVTVELRRRGRPIDLTQLVS